MEMPLHKAVRRWMPPRAVERGAAVERKPKIQKQSEEGLLVVELA
jgi:hypothetical protein